MKPINPQIKPTTPPASHGSASASQTTVGLPNIPTDWLPVINWAQSNGVVDAITLIVDAGFLQSYAESNIIHFLDFVQHSHIRKLLGQWRLVDSSAELLARLAEALEHDNSVYQVTNTPSKSIAKSQVRGNTNTLYLLGMVIADAPTTYDATTRADFLTLKLWTLLQLLNQAANGIYQEAYRVELAQRLRQCEDTAHDFAAKVIRQILPGTEEYDLLPHLLGKNAEKVRLKLREKKETAARRFLGMVIKIAAGETGKKGIGPNGKKGYGWFKSCGGQLPLVKPISMPPQLPELEDDEPQLQYLPLDEDDDVLLIDLGAIKDSLAELRVQQQDFLALNVEQQQCLPWSWRNPNPQEITALDAWIGRTLQATTFSHQLLAAFAWVARHCGRTLKQVMAMGIDNSPDAEWRWNSNSGCLHRLPPKRRNAWEPAQLHRQWINPLATRLELALDKTVQNLLSQAYMQQPNAQTLGDFWKKGTDAYALFRTLTRTDDLKRLQPGMLANILQVKSYQATGNGTLSRLLTAHSNRGLPGACAYPSFLGSEVRTFVSTTEAADIAMGSRLDPIDSLLKQSVAKATARLEKASKNEDLVGYHNVLTAYLREAVLAASGIRPVKDLIESPRMIDPEMGFLYVNDKASSKASQGRLAPLTASLATYLHREYPRYLKKFSRALREIAPLIADEIDLLAQGIPSEKIPYLFLLEVADGKLGWKSASTRNLANLALFDHPLPANVWRHRLPDRLRCQGIDQEIIDGILGHLENNTGSYGPYSPRSWAKDRKQVQPIIEDAFSILGFQLPSVRRSLPALQRQISFEKPLQPGAFGHKAREKARRQKKRQAYLEANAQIDGLLKGRVLTDLKENELQQIAWKLCIRPDGKPHPSGLFRFAHFRRRIDAAWRKQGKRVNTGGQWFSAGYSEKSLFLPEAVGASALYRILKRSVRSLIDKVLKASRSHNKDAALMAMLSLCLEHRISHPTLLLAIIEKRDFRIIIHKRRAYLEYAPALLPQLTPGAVQRFPIQVHTARLLDASLAQKQPYSLDEQAPPYLNTLVKPLVEAGHLKKRPAKLRELVQALARLVDQYNLLTLPAIDAAILSGTTTSYSLTWADRLRLETGKPTQVQYDDEEYSPSADENPLPLYSQAPTDEQKIRELYESSAKQCFDDLRRLIPPATEESKWSTREKRKKLSRDLIKGLHPHVGKVSSATLLLGQWVAHLATRKPTGKREFLRFNSMRRYLSALSVPFAQLGYAFDLANADASEITDYYRCILQLGKPQTQAYRAKRLVSFHQWARNKGLGDPEWSELPNIPSMPEVAPGLITEDEYLQVFQHLLAQSGIPHQLMDVQAFVWLCAYRYGLRENEALYLRATDWMMDNNNRIILFVRRNPLRRLKTDPSRRQVPGLDALTADEEALMARILTGNKRHHEWETAPYIIDDQWRDASWQVYAGILSMIKTVTGNPDLVIHHGRHAAGNQVGIALYQPLLPACWDAFVKDTRWQQETRLQLLGRDETTRRSSWAGCRYLGHARPDTTSQNYWHFLIDAVVERLSIDNRVSPRDQWKHVIELDKRIRQGKPQPPPAVDHAERPLTPERLIELFQYLGNGRTPMRAAHILRVNPQRCEAIHQLLTQLGRKMLRGIHTKYGASGDWSEPPFPLEGFLNHITLDGWRRLAQLCMDHPLQPSTAPIDLDKLDCMIGASRHLLMWEESQFIEVRRFLTHYHLPETLYQVVFRSGSGPDIKQWAEKQGFVVVSQKDAAGPKAKVPVQLDTVRKGNGRTPRDEDRCALIVKKNGNLPVHNGYELAVLFLVWSLGKTP